MSRTFLITGADGMLGTALQHALAEEDIGFVALTRRDLDVTSRDDVATAVERFSADLAHDERGILVNAAAYTNVEGAENEPDEAYRVNAEAPGSLAHAAHDAGLGFVHVSTDFVFDGTKVGPYVETDTPNPLSVYGASKLAGERAVLEANPSALIVRTAWTFGPNGINFPLKILGAAREGRELRVVDDEIGSPTYSADLAAGILALVAADAPAGIYHLAGSGTVSRYDMACFALREAGIDVPVARAKAADYPSKAKRPANSTLDCSKAAALGVVLPDWQSGITRYVATVTAQRISDRM